MSRIHTITHPHGVQRLDLIHVRGIWKPNGPGKWSIGMGSEYEDFTIDPTEGAALEAAWLAFHGEHSPRPDEAGPGLPASRPLPDGWRWSGGRVVGPRGVEVFADDEGDLVISGHWFAPIAVVEAAIAAHRARVGGAS